MKRRSGRSKTGSNLHKQRTACRYKNAEGGKVPPICRKFQVTYENRHQKIKVQYKRAA